MRKIGGSASPTVTGTETAKSTTAATTSTPATAPQQQVKTEAPQEKPLTEGTKTQRKQEKQLSGVMKQAAFQLGSSKSTVSSQAKYGPTADLSEQQQKQLTEHYGDGPKGKNPLDRLTQYDAKHSTYVKAAEQSGRGLTQQEATAKASGKNTKDASIDHVIASGTGQNILNEGTLQFKEGQKKVDQNYQTAISKDATPEQIQSAQKEVRSGIASQAAAAGRMQGYSREILKERKGEAGIDVDAKRSEVLQGTLKAFQGKTKEERFDSYKSVLKQTFDSPGNLRVGDSSANTKISTGFDAPLDAEGKPTAQAERLLHTHQTFAPDRLLTDDRVFTKDSDGKIMSSSKEVKKDKS